MLSFAVMPDQVAHVFARRAVAVDDALINEGLELFGQRNVHRGHGAQDSSLGNACHSDRPGWVLHPGQYAALLLPPTAQGDSLAQAQSRIVDIFVRVTQSTGAAGDDAVHAARAVRSAIHGFVALESVDAFTSKVDRDASFDHLIASILRGLLP